MRRGNHSGWSHKASTLWTQTRHIWRVISLYILINYQQTSCSATVLESQNKKVSSVKVPRVSIFTSRNVTTIHKEHPMGKPWTKPTRVGGAVFAGVKDPDLWALSLADAGYLEVDRPASDVLGIESPLSARIMFSEGLPNAANFTIWHPKASYFHLSNRQIFPCISTTRVKPLNSRITHTVITFTSWNYLNSWIKTDISPIPEHKLRCDTLNCSILPEKHPEVVES
jgi:hypothetical protein